MKKGKAIFILIVLVFASLTIDMSFVKADIYDYGIGFTIKSPYVTSPINTTYNGGFLTLNVTFHALIDTDMIYSMNYSLDGSKNASVPLTSHYFGFFLQNESYIYSLVNLPALNAGSHNISVYLEFVHKDLVSREDLAIGGGNSSRIYHDSQTVYFTTLGTSSPTPLEFLSIIVISVLIVAITVTVILYKKKHNKLKYG